MPRPRKNTMEKAEESLGIEPIRSVELSPELLREAQEAVNGTNMGASEIMEEPAVTVSQPVMEQASEPVTVAPQGDTVNADGKIVLGAMTVEEMESLREERVDTWEPSGRTRASQRATEVRSIREAPLSTDQRSMLLEDGFKKVLAKGPVDGRIPALVKYGVDADGLTNVYAFYDIDIRTVRQAYEFYRDNADNPTGRGFIDYLSKTYAKPKRIIPKLAILDITNTPRRSR